MSFVYRDLDQAALDYQYNNRVHVADPQRYLDWYTTASEAARTRVTHVPDIAYGPQPDERLDIFTPAGTNPSDRRAVVAFVHGGAWQHLDLSRSSFAAETFTARGALYVPIGFTRMPAAESPRQNDRAGARTRSSGCGSILPIMAVTPAGFTWSAIHPGPISPPWPWSPIGRGCSGCRRTLSAPPRWSAASTIWSRCV